MKFGHIRYRTLQFWNAVFANPGQADLERARTILTQTQMSLFTRMQRSEQAHSLAVMNKILETSDGVAGEELNDLLVAALLHDAGKTCYPLQLWERIMIVLGKYLFPAIVRRWESGEPVGWRRAFVIASQHPEWGAELAASAGATPLAVDLIRRHQNYEKSEDSGLAARLLTRLQSADQDS